MSERQAELRSLIQGYRRKQLSRAEFVRRAAAMGCAVPVIAALIRAIDSYGDDAQAGEVTG